MYAYTYINACDAIGPAIHKNGLFYGREADCTLAVHEFVRFYGRPIVSGQSGAGQPHSEVPPEHIALLHSPKTTDGASQSPLEALSGHIALLHSARRRRREVTGSQAVRRKPQTEQETNEQTKTQEFYCISAEATTFATLARRAATLPLSAGWTRWVRSITAQRASRSMTIEVPV